MEAAANHVVLGRMRSRVALLQNPEVIKKITCDKHLWYQFALLHFHPQSTLKLEDIEEKKTI